MNSDWCDSPREQATFRERKRETISHMETALGREPDAGNPHVRFDEREVETEPWTD
jgi:hypothetical protein